MEAGDAGIGLSDEHESLAGCGAGVGEETDVGEAGVKGRSEGSRFCRGSVGKC